MMIKDRISTQEMLLTLNSLPKRKIKLNTPQKSILNHKSGPLWIIAGPGSGKTETLVLRTLKLILVDKIDPRSILITTFTEKGARNLQDRIILYKDHICQKFPFLSDIDTTQLRIGTLHSLCNDILLEYRYSGYRNFRPLDDLEQSLFIYFHSKLANSSQNKLKPEYIDFLKHFQYLLEGRAQGAMKKGYQPSKWARTQLLQNLFNRIVEYRLDTKLMETQGGYWAILANEFHSYEQSLEENSRVDFAHMQAKMSDFLDTPKGKLFVASGGAKPGDQGLSHILVDEYQDTNPIQAEIYFKLSLRQPYNLVVVGDDDQALYRFRGGTVESMINFDKMCKEKFGVIPKSISLLDNYRSHPTIVNWCNAYIKSFDTMKVPGARVADKKDLGAKSDILGPWPGVTLFISDSDVKLANKFVELINYFKNKKNITDYSQCVLLCHSTKETKTWVSAYTNALDEEGIPFYNPRARQFLEQEEVRLALGALLTVLDPNRTYPWTPDEVQEKCNGWRDYFDAELRNYPQLKDYITKAAKKISKTPKDTYLDATLQEIFYHIINNEPFVTWITDIEKALRIGQITAILETYGSTPVPKHIGVNRGSLKMSEDKPGEISRYWKQQFYNALMSLIQREGMNDPENEELIVPSGKVSFMTVHQAKGLQFPLVFVTRTENPLRNDPLYTIEEEMNPFCTINVCNSTAEQKAREDRIRFFFVAYSRAQYALFLMHKTKNKNPDKVIEESLGLGQGNLKWLQKYVKVWRL